MRECSPEHSRSGTVRLGYDKETEEEGKQKRVKMDRSGYEEEKSRRRKYVLGPTYDICRLRSKHNDSSSIMYNMKAKQKLNICMYCFPIQLDEQSIFPQQYCYCHCQ